MKDKNIEKLLPCPFCGLPARIEEPKHAEAWGRWVTPVRCSSSHCRATIELPSDFPEVHERLTEAWNRRAMNIAEIIKEASNVVAIARQTNGSLSEQGVAMHNAIHALEKALR